MESSGDDNDINRKNQKRGYDSAHSPGSGEVSQNSSNNDDDDQVERQDGNDKPKKVRVEKVQQRLVVAVPPPSSSPSSSVSIALAAASSNISPSRASMKDSAISETSPSSSPPSSSRLSNNNVKNSFISPGASTFNHNQRFDGSAAASSSSSDATTHTSNISRKPKSAKASPSSSSSCSPNKNSKKSPPERKSSVSSSPSSSPSPTKQQKELQQRRNNRRKRMIWDLESAMIYLVQAGLKKQQRERGGNKIGEDENDEKEYLLQDKSAWVTFRVGHAGDASTIATWYRQSCQQLKADKDDDVDHEHPELVKNDHPILTTTTGSGSAATTTNTTSDVAASAGDDDDDDDFSPMLEVWLADGLGDEDTPPSVYCLLANVHTATRRYKKDPEKAGVSMTDDNGDVTIEEAEEQEDSSTSNPSCKSELGAVAILTLEWSSSPTNHHHQILSQDSAGASSPSSLDEINGNGNRKQGGGSDKQRVLRIEWMYHDPNFATELVSVLMRKVWLRLSTLSLMTACDMMSVDEKYIFYSNTEEPNNANGGQQQTQKSSSTKSNGNPTGDNDNNADSSATMKRLQPSAE